MSPPAARGTGVHRERSEVVDDEELGANEATESALEHAGELCAVQLAQHARRGDEDHGGHRSRDWPRPESRAPEADRWLRARVFPFRDEYARRFGATSRWVRTIAVHRLVEALPARPDDDPDPSADVERT